MDTWIPQHADLTIPSLFRSQCYPLLRKTHDAGWGGGISLSSHPCIKSRACPMPGESRTIQGRVVIFAVVFDKGNLVLQVNPGQTSNAKKKRLIETKPFVHLLISTSCLYFVPQLQKVKKNKSLHPQEHTLIFWMLWFCCLFVLFCFALAPKFLILTLCVFKHNIKNRMKRGGGCPSPGAWLSVRDHSITTAPGLSNSNAPRAVDVKYTAISLYCVLGMLPWQRREEVTQRWLESCFLQIGLGRNERFQARLGRGFLGNPMDPGRVNQSVVLHWQFTRRHMDEQLNGPSVRTGAFALFLETM